MRAPTKRQREVLQAFSDLSVSGFPPSIRELCRHFGLSSTSGMAQHLEALESRDLLINDPTRSRSRRLTPLGRALLVGRKLVEPVPERRCVQCNAARFGPGRCPQCGEAVTAGGGS
jgi:repressor LexA